MEETSVGVGVGVAKKKTDSVKLANRIKKKGNCKLESWFGA